MPDLLVKHAIDVMTRPLTTAELQRYSLPPDCRHVKEWARQAGSSLRPSLLPRTAGRVMAKDEEGTRALSDDSTEQLSMIGLAQSALGTP